VAYLLLVPSGSSILTAPLRAIWPVVLAVTLRFGASRYMYNFWATKAKVPLVDQYNAAISHSMDIIGFLDLLSAGWASMAVLKAVSLRWWVRNLSEDLGVIGASRTSPRKQLGLPIVCDQIDIFVAHAEAVL
jgi:hypothetical protein